MKFLSFLLCTTATLAAPTKPTFPGQWSSQLGESAHAVFDGPGSRIAVSGLPTQYPVQISNYKDGPNGRVYFLTLDSAGNRFCRLWCEVPYPSIYEDPLSLNSIGYNKDAKFLRNETLRGIPSSIWDWEQKAGPIPLEETFLWVDESGPSPVRIVHDVFVQHRGNETIDFVDFTPLTQVPESAFDLGDKTACDDQKQPAAQCSRSELFSKKLR